MTNNDPLALATEMIRDFDDASIRDSIAAHDDVDDLIDAMIDDAPEDEALYAALDDAVIAASLRDPSLHAAIRAEITRRFSI